MPSNTAPHQLITYRDFLTQQDGPLAFYLIEDNADHPPQVCWILKACQSIIHILGPTPLIEFRIGAFQVGSVLVVVVLIRIGTAHTIIESWINGYNSSCDGLRVMELLQSQSHIILHFFNEHIFEQRALRIENPSCHFFQNCYERILSGPQWTMEEFDRAKEQICDHYPDPTALWDALHT